MVSKSFYHTLCEALFQLVKEPLQEAMMSLRQGSHVLGHDGRRAVRLDVLNGEACQLPTGVIDPGQRAELGERLTPQQRTHSFQKGRTLFLTNSIASTLAQRGPEQE